MLKKYSKEGNKNLSIIDKFPNFTNWMYSEIKPYLTGDILEVGSGLGTYSEKIVKDFKNSKIILSDIDYKYLKELKVKFKHKKNITITKLDLSNFHDFKKLNQKLDSVFALNVLEHIEDDISTLNNIYKILRKKGKSIILVPAHKFLFNCIDSSIGHYRRYSKKEIIEKISKTKFKIKKIFYFNFLSIFGWYINGNILKKKIVNENAIGVLNKIVPFLKFFEKYILMKKIGISLIIILEKD